MFGQTRWNLNGSSVHGRLRVPRRAPLWTEGLEARRLLVAPPINVALDLPIATGLPVPGLATGYGVVATAQSLPSTLVSVAPPSIEAVVISPGGPPSILGDVDNIMATGPATTLSALMNDSETANAPASEVARPRPGLSDRISIILGSPAYLAPIRSLRVPTEVRVTPSPNHADPTPKISPEVPAAPAVDPAAPAENQAPPVENDPTLASDSHALSEPVTLATWDGALLLLAGSKDSMSKPDGPELATMGEPTQAALAAGTMLAAWVGWKSQPGSTNGRSRRHAQPIPAVAVRPTGGPGR